MKIYTKTGDKGITSLYDGRRVEKSDTVFFVLGDLDELSVHIGLLFAIKEVRDLQISIEGVIVSEFLRRIQRTLLDIGTIIATPSKPAVFDPELTKELERSIDFMTESLPPLKNFLLFGSPTGEEIPVHLCRVITRRVERGIVGLGSIPNLIEYINRLSDFFYTLARYVLLATGNSEEKNK